MKAKTVRGSGFRGCLDYVLGKKGVERVGGNMSGRTPRELAKEFGQIRKNREDITKPVWHCSLSLPQGEKLSSEKWSQVVESFLREMGLDPEKHQYVMVRHTDTEHDHVHLVVNRVTLTGKVWDYRNDVYRAIEATQRLEKKFGLTVTEARSKPGKPKLSRGEFEMVRRTKINTKKDLAEAIALVTQKQCSVPEFIRRCKVFGFDAVPNISKTTGKMNGFSFSIPDTGKNFKGSKLGWGWKNLSQQVTYDPSMQDDIQRAIAGRYEPEQTPEVVPAKPEKKPGPKQWSTGFKQDRKAGTDVSGDEIPESVPEPGPESEPEWTEQELEPEWDVWGR